MPEKEVIETVESIVPGQPEMSEELREVEKAKRAQPGEPDLGDDPVPYVNAQNILVDARSGKPIDLESQEGVTGPTGVTGVTGTTGVTGVTGVTGASAQRSGDGASQEQRDAARAKVETQRAKETAERSR